MRHLTILLLPSLQPEKLQNKSLYDPTVPSEERLCPIVRYIFDCKNGRKSKSRHNNN